MGSILRLFNSDSHSSGVAGSKPQLVLHSAMTSHLSDIGLGSAIAIVVGIGTYILVRTQLERAVEDLIKRNELASDPLISQLRTASALHAKAWGKPWPQSDGTISGDEIGPVDDEDDDDVDGAFADKLKVPSEFEYRSLEEIRTLKSALGANPGEDEEDFLVVHKEYEILREGLEHESKYKRAIVMTGHPGIGSYETWF
jgi:hypothetical protein